MAQAFARKSANTCSTSSLRPRSRASEWDWPLFAPLWNRMAAKSKRRMSPTAAVPVFILLYRSQSQHDNVATADGVVRLLAQASLKESRNPAWESPKRQLVLP